MVQLGSCLLNALYVFYWLSYAVLDPPRPPQPERLPPLTPPLFSPRYTSDSAGHVRLVHADGDGVHGRPHRHVRRSSTGGGNGGPDVAGSPLPDLEGRPAPHRLHRHEGRVEETRSLIHYKQKKK